MKKTRRPKCNQCGQLYKPDPRNRTRQYTCSAPACQKARHQANQQAWSRRPENINYFRGPVHVRRVREWRKAHPGYGRKTSKTLQDALNAQTVDNDEDKSGLSLDVLQDALLRQPAVLIGLISTLTGDALQDAIARQIVRLHHRGQQILLSKGKGNDDQETYVMSGATAQAPGTV